MATNLLFPYAMLTQSFDDESEITSIIVPCQVNAVPFQVPMAAMLLELANATNTLVPNAMSTYSLYVESPNVGNAENVQDVPLIEYAAEFKSDATATNIPVLAVDGFP